jgi:ABC-type lipoprotein export system ATPase subunit
LRPGFRYKGQMKVNIISSLIELKDIQKTYRIGESEYPVLKGIDLTIESGEFIALMGPSGSGKSTLLNIVGF